MMKKIRLLIISLLFVVLSVSCVFFAGCFGGNDSTEESENSADRVVLADFEEWAPDFQLLRLKENFGSIEVNADAKYVKSGAQSAKLIVMGNEKTGNPYFFVQTQSNLFGYDYSDFSKIKHISAWVYNSTNATATLYMGLVTKVLDIANVSASKPVAMTLNPGWNEVIYVPDMNTIISGVGVKNYHGIEGIYFMFDNPKAALKKDAPVYYLDDVALNYGEELEFKEVKVGTYYSTGSRIGGANGMFLEDTISMSKLEGKALHLEFKFESDNGRFAFAIMANNWANITGTLAVTNENGVVSSNFGRIKQIEEGWYAWELNYALFAGDGAHRATEVGLIYHQNERVSGGVEINWLSLSAVEPYTATKEDSPKYIYGEYVGGANGQWLKNPITMASLKNKALRFEFKFEKEGRFGFALFSSNWANITGTVIITKENGKVTSNLGQIEALENGWYAWKINYDSFSGNGMGAATEVALAYHENVMVTGTILIDWYSFAVIDAYGLNQEEQSVRYTNGQNVGNIRLSNPIDMAELEGKALHLEFKFESDGSFGFVMFAVDSANNWYNVTNVLIVTKSGDSVTSNIGRIVTLENGWYAWELNHEDFGGDGMSKAKNISVVYHENQVISGTVLIDWLSLRAENKY